jgi:hypothetical protein
VIFYDKKYWASISSEAKDFVTSMVKANFRCFAKRPIKKAYNERNIRFKMAVIDYE